jgi:hypothetical protein
VAGCDRGSRSDPYGGTGDLEPAKGRAQPGYATRQRVLRWEGALRDGVVAIEQQTGSQSTLIDYVIRENFAGVP